MGDAPGTVLHDQSAGHLRAVPLPGTLLLPLPQRTPQRTTAFAGVLQAILAVGGGRHVAGSQHA